MATDMAQKALELTRVCSEMLKRAQATKTAADAEKQAVADAVPAAVQSLVKHERIFENQADAVREKLASSHLACIELIRDLAAHRNTAEIGKPVGGQEKNASVEQRVRPLGSPVVDYDQTESGRAFRDAIMGARG
jgi:hypothetical protein